MAAGLGFKTFTTGEVLTAADTNGYLMQGVLVFASAAARDAAITSPQEGQFAYLKDTNVTTYYTGSAWANLDTTGMTNPMTTTGDTIYSSSGSTPARLGIGSTGNVLTVAGGIPSWAAPAAGGGMTLINSGGTTLTGAGITISSIPSTYKHLFVLIENVYFASNNGALYLRPNASGSTNYAGAITVGGGVTTDTTFSAGGEFVVNLNNTTNSTAKQKTQSAIWIYDYAGASNKFICCQTMAYNGAWNTTTTNGVWVDTTALSSLRTYGDYDFTDGTIYVYGVN